MEPTWASAASEPAGVERSVAVSVVVPIYSGATYLEELVQELDALRTHWESTGAPISLAEAIFVDDSAIDESPALIDRLAAERPWIVSLHLARNFGQHAATIAGILHSAGDWVATLDEDLQHPPGHIPDLLRHAVETSADVVYANPTNGVHASIGRDLSSRSFKRLIEWLTRNPNVRIINSFRLMRGSVARAASSVCSHETYFDVALSWFTQRFELVPMTLRDERYISTGKSGYNSRSLMSHARRMLVSSQLKALRLGALFGLVAVGLSGLGIIALVIAKLVVPETIAADGWTSLMLTIVFFGGVVVLLLGIILEYLSSLVLRAHGKPLFFTIDRSTDAQLIDYFRSARA